MRRNNITLLLGFFFLNTYAHTESRNENSLRNIKQLTFPAMGFEKAGESYFSPDGKTLLFQAVPTGQKHYQMYAINTDGTNLRLISTGRGACTCAFFRPDGKKIIFASSHESPDTTDDINMPGYQRDSKNYVWDFTPYMNIYEANCDGSELKALTTGPAYNAECAYSTDGSHIVFASNRSGHMNLYTIRADGSDVQPLTNTENVYNGGPFFSPDGKSVIYRADHQKRHYLQIYTIDVGTKKIQQLTNNTAVNWAPFWHPCGDVIVFTTSLHGHTQYELYLLNIKTDKQYRLTHNATFDGLGTFNKQGTQITWTSKRGADQTCQIFIADFVMPTELF